MKAVIMAGGFGSRLKPLTDNIPKPMLPILNKPILQYTIERLKFYGVTEIAMTLNYKPESIVDYFGDGSNFGVNLTYFYENEPLGTAGSIKNASSFLEDTFLVLSGDAFTNLNFEQLWQFHMQKGAKVSLFAKYVEDCRPFGMLSVDDDNKITSFLEKPLQKVSGIVNTGIYVMQKEVLDLIPNGFYDFSKNLFPQILNQMFAFEGDYYWSDIGTLPQYYITNFDYVTTPKQFNFII
ncbi:MAG: nucleotidyltransferase family protein [Clostridia bacterium]